MVATGVSALRVTITIATLASLANSGSFASQLPSRGGSFAMNWPPADVFGQAIRGSTAMTRTAFCRKSPRVPKVVGWKLGPGNQRPRSVEGSAARNRSGRWKTAGATIDGAVAPPAMASQQRGRRAMEFFSGLDVGMDETAICVVDDKGGVALQTTVVTDPDAIKAALKPYLGRLRRVGHEAGALSPWLHRECSSSACRQCVWRPSMCARRCRRSATRPTRRMRSAWRI